ncbi:MAG TPA: Xaa-Pro peptidase family protein [Candidatus Polarisedimenticolia bacterium]|nr:Xaa-Pro peptidase family protein [Candidatus Polarisedimenticolia bacterium]
MPRIENLLIVADSDHDANMLYATGMFVPDPFIYLRLRGKNFIVMSDLEMDRARRQAEHCRVLSLSRYQKQLADRHPKRTGYAHVIESILKEKRVQPLLFVPANFPLGLARELKRLKIKVKVKTDFFSEREIKSVEEVKKISAALMMAEVGMAEAMQALKSAKISRDRRLMYRGAPLTSEKLRSIIDCAILQAGGLAAHTIVAGGKQGCDPHEAGHGQLFANELLIIDIFPRSQKTGYFGDITRTVVRGRASETARKLYDTVLRAQMLAFDKIRADVPTAEIHGAVQQFFVQQGYKTARHNGRMQGFFHGTGHGLGLEIHEAPRVGSTSRGVLKSGQIVTVEPGLYYPEIGGVRIEDVALVTARAARNLTQFEKVLEL